MFFVEGLECYGFGQDNEPLIFLFKMMLPVMLAAFSTMVIVVQTFAKIWIAKCKEKRRFRKVSSRMEDFESSALLSSEKAVDRGVEGPWTKAKEKMLEVSLFIFFVMYFELSEEIFSVFSCVTVYQEPHMAEMPWIECSVRGGGEYTWLFVQAVLFASLYSAGFVVLIAVLLWRNYANKESHTTPIAFLYSEYRVYYFELLLMSRRLLLSLFLALSTASESPYLRFLIQAVLQLSLAIQIALHPFHHMKENVLEACVLLVLLLSVGATANEERLESDHSFPYVLLALNGLMLLTLVGALLMPWVSKMRQKCRNRERKNKNSSADEIE